MPDDKRLCRSCGQEIHGVPEENADFCNACRDDMEGPGTLAPTEPHPAALDAHKYVLLVRADFHTWAIMSEAFNSTALTGNRLAIVCSETIMRLDKGWPVSDRYMLGLAWAVRNMVEKRPELKKRIGRP
jgi:hypothetical protein